MSGFVKGITKREALAFKAGGWASLPIDYVIEKYGIPYAKKHFSEKAFYDHISRMPTRRGRRLTAAVISQDPMEGISMGKRPGDTLLSVAKRARRYKGHGAASGEKKVHFQEISPSTQSVGTMRSELLFNLSQGAERGQRLGSRIHAHSIDVRGYLRNSNASLSTFVRILFVQDNKPQVGVVTTNLFQPESPDNDPVNYSTGGDLAQITKMINTNRYRVISDRRFKLAPAVTSANGDNFQVLSYKVKFDRYIEYLTENELTDTNKITPNYYAFLFVETETGGTGTGILSRDVQLYHNFSG